MANIVSGLKSIQDYQRAEEEFQLKKQKAMAEKGGGLPAALQMANSIQEDLDASNKATTPEESAAYRQRANLKAQAAKMFDKGLNPYGNADSGGMVLPDNPLTVPSKPEQPEGLLPLLFNALQGEKTPAAPAWRNPDMQVAPMGVQPIQGYGVAAGSIEADRKGMGRQAEKNVDLTMNPQITRAETDQKNISNLNYDPLTKAATTAADVAAKSKAEATTGLADFISRTEGQLNVIDQMIGNPDKNMVEHPGLKGAVGGLDSRLPSFRDESVDFDALLEQAKGGAFLTSIGQLQGMGALSNAEGATATIAATRMKNATSEAGFRKAAQEYREQMVKGMERMRQKAGNPEMPLPTSPYAPKETIRTATEPGKQEYNAAEGKFLAKKYSPAELKAALDRKRANR